METILSLQGDEILKFKLMEIDETLDDITHIDMRQMGAFLRRNYFESCWKYGIV